MSWPLRASNRGGARGLFVMTEAEREERAELLAAAVARYSL
jgi:hypothetical protein